MALRSTPDPFQMLGFGVLRQSDRGAIGVALCVRDYARLSDGGTTRMPVVMTHFTDKEGFNGINSAKVWKFIAAQPPAPRHPRGAYFTTLGRNAPLLAQRLRIPRTKTEHVFEFVDAGDLEAIEGGRGAFIFFSRVDYLVSEPRQRYAGPRDSR